MPWSIAARSPSRGSINKRMTRQSSRASIIPTSCRAFPCWRRCRTRSPGGSCGCRAIRSTSAAFPYWAADYWVTLGTSGLFTAGDGCPARALGARAGLLARTGVLDRPGLRTGDAGLRLRHARLRTPGVGICPVRVVFPAVEEKTARATHSDCSSPASWRPTRP